MSAITVDTSPEQPFYTTKTLALKLQVSERTIRNWVNSGELASYTLGDLRRFDPADVASFLDAHRDRRRAA